MHARHLNALENRGVEDSPCCIDTGHDGGCEIAGCRLDVPHIAPERWCEAKMAVCMFTNISTQICKCEGEERGGVGGHLMNEEDDKLDDVITILIMQAPSNHEFFIS